MGLPRRVERSGEDGVEEDLGRAGDVVKRRPRQLVGLCHRSIGRRPGGHWFIDLRGQRVCLAEGEGLLQRFTQAPRVDRLRGREEREVRQVLHARVWA